MLSLKQIGTICLSFFLILISTKSFSENIPSENPTCDNSTLGVYSGSVALEPDWGANKIPIRWYNNNTLITDVTAQESECTYDGTIDVATEPSRTGYNFRGWKVSPQMDFSTLTALGRCTMNYGKGSDGNSDWCQYFDGGWRSGSNLLCEGDVHFHDLNKHEWKTGFTTGTVYGMAHCSAKSGDYHNISWGGDSRDWSATLSQLDAAEGEKKYCYCFATEWQPSGEQTRYRPFIDSLILIYAYGYDSSYACQRQCASHCAYFECYTSGFRAALFATPAATN